MSGHSFKGDIYLGIYNDQGKFLGYLPEILNVDELTFTPGEQERINRISRKRVTDGQTLDSFGQTTSAATMTLATDEQIPEIMAINLSSVASKQEVSSSQESGLEIVCYTDTWTKLPHVNIKSDNPKFELKDDQDAELTEDTDYEVDYRTGMVRLLKDDTEGETHKATYEYEKVTFVGYTGMTKTETRARIYGDMEDRVTGKRGELIVHEVRFSVGEDINLMTPDAFLVSTLEGTLITPSGKDGPFEFRFYEPGD